ncbi:MAG: hypothetical protein KDD11_03140 [Acidobacteria bacterium]|nr:hypothetical protein [Acidobacteriota bacterium]
MSRSLESGSVLSRSLAMLIADFPALFGLSLLAWSPRIVLAVIWPEIETGGDIRPTTIVGVLATIALAVFLAQIQTVLVALRLWRSASDSEIKVARSSRLLVPVVVSAVAVSVLTALAFGFFLIPGWIVLAGLFVTLPALLAEGGSPFAAPGRSWQLMDGHKLPIFALVLMLSVVERCFDLLTDYLKLPALVGVFAAVLVYALQAVAAVVTYEDLTGHGPDLVLAEPPSEAELAEEDR